MRHPGLEPALAVAEPAGTQETMWGNGTVPLRVTAFLGRGDLPSELVTSVRCIVRVRDQMVVCELPTEHGTRGQVVDGSPESRTQTRLTERSMRKRVGKLAQEPLGSSAGRISSI